MPDVLSFTKRQKLVYQNLDLNPKPYVRLISKYCSDRKFTGLFIRILTSLPVVHECMVRLVLHAPGYGRNRWGTCNIEVEEG